MIRIEKSFHLAYSTPEVLPESNIFLCNAVSLTDQKLTSQVHEIVGRINGRFGTLTAVPIHHLVCFYLLGLLF